ncbi:uncharacterized protein LOC116337624 [Contarinia nasturtii]|uniref:uncharacterized protein LOC116337624 n=1 Tax=Contarinia nasturtii TaxID=265458 RepID=UPI0012D466D2|nr:uncharacterized protein LOC116337624 [Contarinia nasturtii]
MGGCRCTFRDCSNNTINSPGKHFFHFPFKDNVRCKKWALNSEKVLFLRLPWTQLRNKTVCEDHFIDSCFMNFKKERLVKTAVPTLYQEDNGNIIEIKMDNDRFASLEYSFNEKGVDQKTIDLPDSWQTIHFNLSVNEAANADDDYNTTVVSDSSVSETLDLKPTTIHANVLNDTKPIVLNRVCMKGSLPAKHFSVRNVQEKPIIKRPNYIADENTGTTYLKPIKRIKTEGAVSRTYGKSSQNNSTSLTDAQESGSSSPNIDYGCTNHDRSDALTVNLIEKINHIEERDANKVDKSLYMKMMADHAKQIEDLKQLLTDKLSEKRDTQNQGYSSASSSTDARQIRMEKGPAMTKVQLFNGIRKYLNPTMVALLRMEMFGSSEREYRADEKQLSKELYNLNQSVYDFMRDEWRFRLPPKADVEEWLKSPDEEETWDLC